MPETAEQIRQSLVTVNESAAEQAKTAVATEPTETPGVEQPKHKGGFQKKIDKLTRRISELESENEGLKAVRTRVAEDPAPEAETTAAPAGDRPKRENYPSEEAYRDAETDWKVDQRLVALEKQEMEKAEKERLKTVFDAYNAKVAEARATHEDFNEVVGRSDIRIPQSVQLAVIEMENGPEVAYHLGKNPELCDKLNKMSQLSAVMEVTRIASALNSAEEIEEEEEAETAPPPKARPKPPAPVRAVNGSSSRSSVPRGEMPLEDYIRMRNEEIRNSRRH